MSKQQTQQAPASIFARMAQGWKWLWQRVWRFLLAGGIGLTIIGTIVYVGFWHIVSHTAPLVSAQAVLLATPVEFAPGVPAPPPSQQPAGSSAYVGLILDGKAITLSYPKTATTPAHQFAGVLGQATCELVAKDAPGAPVFVLAVRQRFIWNAVTGQVILIDGPSHFSHTNYLWDLIQPPTVAISSSAMSMDKVITLDGLVSRSSAYGVASESYDVTLTLTIAGDGDVMCGLFAPPDAFTMPARWL